MVTPLLAVFLLLLAGSASARAAQQFLPPAGKLFAGVTDDPVSAYETAVGQHPAVYQEFVAWGEYLPYLTQDATNARARMMMAISPVYGGREVITPQQIALGQGDAWLIGLNRAIAASHNITYIRWMAEMNNINNPYSDCDHGAGNSAGWFVQAWRRAALILRGGSLAHIDTVLRRLGLPKLRTRGNLPAPQVSMLWVPMVAPNCGPATSAYFPGRAWVDWVGTDFYSLYPNFGGLNAFSAAYPGYPFVFGEYALWGGDAPGWINELFGWAYSHPQVRMLVYNQGAATDGPFRLLRYPLGAAALRVQLASGHFAAYAPEWARPGGLAGVLSAAGQYRQGYWPAGQ